MRLWLTFAKDFFSSLVKKLQGILTGDAPVSKSCQIPDLKDRLRECRLNNRRGTFVEIGAFDGESFSNTSFLADQGWRGVYIEPVKAFCAQVRRRHFLNDVTVINCAIGSNAGASEISVMGELSTVSTDNLEAYENIDWTKERWELRTNERVKVSLLEDAFRAANVPFEFELLVVDIEGEEEGVVDQLLSSAYRPKVAIIELEDKHPDFSKFEKIASSHNRARCSMIRAGYKPVFEDQINTIFCFDTNGALGLVDGSESTVTLSADR